LLNGRKRATSITGETELSHELHDYVEAELLYNSFMRPSLNAAIASLNLPTKNATILDAGCGPGGVFPLLYEAIGSTGEIVGVDFSDPHLVKAREQIKQYGLEKVVKLKKLNLLESLPFPKDFFDAVWVADVIFPDWVESPSKLVRRLAEILKPGGVFAIYYGNWLRSMFLPGYARLEHLICTAHELNRAKGRSWDDHTHPERALGWLREAKFVALRQEILPVHYRNPLPNEVRKYVGTYGLREYYAGSIKAYGDAAGINKKDKKLWKHISNPDRKEFLLDQPDYYCAAFALLTVGLKP
jgi:ubiquinone/menaquinone biosynthesis C-methylase UbiE